jgi:nucleotide-binding universal stress UspA family protein
MADDSSGGTVLIAYDGSDYAKDAIKIAGEQLRDGRRAVVLTVWQPYAATGFAGGAPIPVEIDEETEKEAQGVADEGAELARAAGFDAQGVVERGDPIWQRVVEVADEHDAEVVVLGSHGRTGIPRVLLGSVAATVASHTDRAVLIVHRRGETA